MALPPDAEVLYRSLFAAYPDALLLVDAAGTIAMGNPAASRLLGYSAEELAGMSVDALVPNAIRPRHAAYREAYSHEPRPRPMGTTQAELVARRRDGSHVMVEIALSPLQDHGLPYVVAAVRGIEAYPRMQQALQRARYSEFVAQMGRLAVDTRDPALLLSEVPKVAAQALQLDRAEVYLLEANQLEFRMAGGVGLGHEQCLGSKVANRPDTAPGFVLARGAALSVADYRSERDFPVPAAYFEQGLVCGMAVPLSDRGQTVGVLAVHSRRAKRFDDDEVRFLRSLSNLLAASLQRAHTEEALKHSQRLESVGQLTGGIAHDFNNLLTVIQGNLQVLEEHPAIARDDDAQQLLASAARATRRGAELTGKLLAFSRRQVLSPSRVDVAALVESLADMLRRTLDQRVRIEVDAAGSLACMADAGQLEAALLNLAINARDAMPEGGTLAFACRASGRLSPELADELGVAAHTGAAYVEIDVVDTGRGMSEAVRARAFEPFFTTKELGRGTGLGLATVYGFVKQSHGAVQLRTAPGVGTTVTLVLPRFDAPGAVPAAKSHAGAAVPRGLKVLLVEDESEVRSVVRNHLVALGCRVSDCATAEQALARLAEDTDHDLLLSDIALGPGLRGTELAREVKERLPHFAVLLMSGYSAELLATQGAGAPEPQWLRKPFGRTELAQAIARALGARDRSG